jgi:hypothetical protein
VSCARAEARGTYGLRRRGSQDEVFEGSRVVPPDQRGRLVRRRRAVLVVLAFLALTLLVAAPVWGYLRENRDGGLAVKYGAAVSKGAATFADSAGAWALRRGIRSRRHA